MNNTDQNPVNPQPVPATPVKPVVQNLPSNGTNIAPQTVQQPVQQPVQQAAQQPVQQPVTQVQTKAVQNSSPINPEVVVSVSSKAEATEVIPDSINPNATAGQQETVVTPVNHEVAPLEVNTGKTKSNNTLFFVVIIVLVLVTFFIDDVLDILTEDNYQYLKGKTPESTSSNLINGFIKVGENNSYMSLEKVRFYNFKKDSDGILTFSYVSTKGISKPENLEIFVEIYNSNQELLYKELFDPGSKIENGVVSQYSLPVTNDVYHAAFYAKAVIYTKTEELATSKVICTYKFKTTNIDLTYTNTYNFINNELSSYSVSKTYTSDSINAETEKYKNEIGLEYQNLENYKIKNEHKDNLLTYAIDLSSYPEGFTPLYNLGTVPKTIKNKETLKKWKCE